MRAMRIFPRLTLASLLALSLGTAACGGGSSGSDDVGDEPAAEGAAGGSSGASGWTFTDDNGVTHTLDAAPETVVAQSTIAGGLWEYGVDVAGVFGPLRYADGTPDPAIGLADPEDFESLGEVDSEINVEALAALRPDLIIAPSWGPGPGDYWGIAPDSVETLEQIAPIVAIRVDGRPLDEPLARVGELAASFGDEEAEAVDAARGEFDAASTRFSDAVAAKPGLTVLAASGTLTEFYVAYPPGFPDLSYFASLGLDMVEPTEHPEAGGYWQTLSWEEVGMYPADMVLADVREGSIDFLLDQMPASGLQLPAVQAGQMVAWPAASAVGYGSAAAVLDTLTGSVEAADTSIV